MAGALIPATLAACAAANPAGTPARLADEITRAVYADDLDTTTAHFDEETKKSVTRSELGNISDKMHALGDLKALTQRSADPDTGKYEYDAVFTNGAMLVQLRIDPSGKVGAYRVVPEQAPAAGAATPQA